MFGFWNETPKTPVLTQEGYKSHQQCLDKFQALSERYVAQLNAATTSEQLAEVIKNAPTPENIPECQRYFPTFGS